MQPKTWMNLMEHMNDQPTDIMQKMVGGDIDIDSKYTTPSIPINSWAFSLRKITSSLAWNAYLAWAISTLTNRLMSQARIQRESRVGISNWLVLMRIKRHWDINATSVSAVF